MFIEYKENEKYPLPDAHVSDFHEAFKDAGYILTDTDLIVDIDGLSKDTIKALIKEFDIKTQTVWTDRGVHFYFQKPRNFKPSTINCALGFSCEYKTKKTNKSITIKRNGILRQIDNQGIRLPLPDIFLNRSKKYENLVGLSEGDGRNNKLRDHRIALNDCDGYDKIIRFINNYIFDEPLEEKELNNTILRKDFKMSLSDETQVAKYIIRERNIKLAIDRLFYYDGTRYIYDNTELKRIIFQYLGNVKTKIVEEVFKQIELSAPRIKNKYNFPVKFKNGVLKNGEFIDIDYHDFTYYYVDIDYNPNAEKVQIVEDYLNLLTDNDEDYKTLLLEVLAHCFITDPEMKRSLGKFFIFVGDGGNGKGTLLEIIRKILGTENCSSLSIKQMTDERYLVNIAGKLANLGDDIEGSTINDKDMKVLKNISTCDVMEIRRMYANSYSETITTSLIFTSNHIIKSFEKGESYKRRVMWLKMFNKPKKKDPKFITKITSDKALAYWVKIIVEAYLRLYENNKFTDSQVIIDWNEKYHEENDASSLYLSDYDEDYFIGKKPNDVYNEFEAWCLENDVVPSKKMLTSAIQSQFGLIVNPKKINGKTMRVFVKVTKN